MRGAVACLTAAWWLAGCTAYPVAPADRTVLAPPATTDPASGSPTSDLMTSPAPDLAHLAPAPDRALLVVYRSGLTPTHRAVTIYVNGTTAAELDDGYYTVIQLPPGHTHLESSWSFDLAWLQPAGHADPDLQVGKTYYFRIVDGLSWVGVVGILPLVTDASPAGMGAGAALLVADEAHARYTGRALQAESEVTAASQLPLCSYAPAEPGFDPAVHVAAADH